MSVIRFFAQTLHGLAAAIAGIRRGAQLVQSFAYPAVEEEHWQGEKNCKQQAVFCCFPGKELMITITVRSTAGSAHAEDANIVAPE